ncbi:NAD(P)-dependent alcohol dehydrogenase [Mycobacterium manitobense]|uniref:alcohol dehydrogenase (NADP(+)) n=1 Tax=[Mycobacterium] manitobense TaxID=190147 RepID=A0A9X2YUT6_9MYCO|nr:NAD(P)-dependent alcohol dehydrogenase [[Mycobacterium] manitobense]MCV7174114.1 NAD(P)-dependent alcohol dehydrogenase [[Mycobacterium] manitobense]
MARRVRGLAAHAAGRPLAEWDFERRDLRPDDLAVRITYCGICHTDLHAWHGEPAYGDTFPLVPGHEFVGEVTAIGDAVSGFTVGDAVAVGNIVDSCGVCEMCTGGHEQFCDEFPTLTYGGIDRRDGRPTHGAYSTEYVVTEGFAYHLPDGLDAAGVAPLMCAGITVWEPIEQWKVGPGMSVGVVGLGGLGHLAVKFASALGAEVDLFTTSPAKAHAARRLGVRRVVVSTDSEQMAEARNRYDFIIDTVAVAHDLSGYSLALKYGGTLCLVGALESTSVNPLTMLGRNLTVAGGGGRPATRRMLQFAAEHGISADVEVLPTSAIGDAFDRLARNDVEFRFSLDVAQLTQDGT